MVREYVSYVGRWLSANVEDVVRIEPGPRAPHVAPAPALIPGLLRWRMRLARRRAVTVAGRWLLVALAVGMLLELIGVAVGADRASRALWLIGPALLWVAGATVGLRHHRPRVEDVARLLDRDLALAEVVSTALELEQRVLGDRPQPAGDSLRAVVLAQGSAAVAHSLGAARIVSKSAWPERLAPAALAAVVGLVIILPSSGSGTAERPGVKPAGAVGGSRSATARGTIARNESPVAGSPARSASRAAAPNPTTKARVRPGHAGGQVPTAPSQTLARRSSGQSATGSRPEPSAKVHRTGAARGPAGGHGGGASPRAGAGAPGGASGSRAAAGRSSARAAGSSAHAGGSSARAGRAGVPTAPGKSGAASSKAAAALSARHGAVGGESAGTARGSNAPGAHRPAQGSISSANGLPIQAGYGPSTGKSAKAASGPALSGGRGPARSATVTGSGGSGVAIFPYIPPTPSVLSIFDADPVLRYFSPFSPVFSATWQ